MQLIYVYIKAIFFSSYQHVIMHIGCDSTYTYSKILYLQGRFIYILDNVSQWEVAKKQFLLSNQSYLIELCIMLGESIFNLLMLIDSKFFFSETSKFILIVSEVFTR